MEHKIKNRRKKNKSLNIKLCSERFDLMAKHLYIKSKHLNYDTDYYKGLYHNNIEVFNGCKEPPDITMKRQSKPKNCIEDFINVFDNLINTIPKGYNAKYPIPMNRNIPINGAHRLAICEYFKVKPMIKQIPIQTDIYDYKFFKNMKSIYSDEMALQYIHKNENIRCMILFPCCDDKLSVIENIISDYGNIYYKKSINLNDNGLDNLIKECYRNESWIGGLFPTTTCGKSDLCKGINQTTILLIDMNDTNKLIELKTRCRSIFNLGKNSLHISDYTDDTFRISSSLLNKNSVDFLNKGTNNLSSTTKKLLQTYFERVKNDDEFCLTSSLTLEMYGKRRANDIDYLHRTNRNINEYKIGVHDNEWLKYYHTNVDDILYNPENHFYFNGHKFATLEVVKKMKQNRREPKDIDDLKLLNKKIYFDCNWGELPSKLKKRYDTMTPNNTGRWNDIVSTDDVDSADCIIAMDGSIKKYYDKDVITLPREPFGIHQQLYEYIYHVCSFDFLNKTYDELIDLNYHKKTQLCSAVISNKNLGNTYQQRIDFVKLLDTANIVDIYGKGWKDLEHHKGEIDDKYDALKDYKYSICVENRKLDNYFSEKFTDAILSWTIPIYYGCPNINHYFPEDCYYTIDINDKNVIENIQNILNRPIEERHIKAMKKARELILNEYSLFPVIDKILKGVQP